MRTTAEDIGRWLDRAEKEHTHMLVVCDTYDYEDYPVFVSEGEDVHEVYDKFHGHNMQRVMEVYDLRKDLASQLTESRAMNF